MRVARLRPLTAVAVAAMTSLLVPLSGGALAHETPPCEGHEYGNHTAEVWTGINSLGIVPIPSPENPVAYVDDRNLANGNGLWIYLETNGEFWLQRGGVHPVEGDANAEICNESTNPDVFIF